MKHFKIRIVFNFYGYYQGTMAGSVYDINGIVPTITTMQGGGRQPKLPVIYETE